MERKPIASTGSFNAAKAEVSTYALVGPVYFLFFAALMGAFALGYIFFAMSVKERTYVRDDVGA